MSKKKIDLTQVLCSGMETIEIKAKCICGDNEYYAIPACRKTGEKYFRILHSTLEWFYKQAQEKHPEMKIVMETDLSCITPQYCVAGCHLRVDDMNYESYFGEMKVTMKSAEAEKMSPYNIAVNRARDKAILRDVFGLFSRTYLEDGTPYVNGIDGPDEEEEAAPVLNSVEKREFDELAGYTIPLRQGGKTGKVRLSEMSDNMLGYILSAADPAGVLEPHKPRIRRYMELRDKLEGKPKEIQAPETQHEETLDTSENKEAV